MDEFSFSLVNLNLRTEETIEDDEPPKKKRKPNTVCRKKMNKWTQVWKNAFGNPKINII